MAGVHTRQKHKEVYDALIDPEGEKTPHRSGEYEETEDPLESPRKPKRKRDRKASATTDTREQPSLLTNKPTFRITSTTPSLRPTATFDIVAARKDTAERVKKRQDSYKHVEKEPPPVEEVIRSLPERSRVIAIEAYEWYHGKQFV